MFGFQTGAGGWFYIRNTYWKWENQVNLSHVKNQILKQISFLSLLLSLFSLVAPAQNGDAATIKQLNQQWLNAIMQEDSVSLAKILADDFILINP